MHKDFSCLHLFIIKKMCLLLSGSESGPQVNIVGTSGTPYDLASARPYIQYIKFENHVVARVATSLNIF